MCAFPDRSVDVLTSMWNTQAGGRIAVGMVSQMQAGQPCMRSMSVNLPKVDTPVCFTHNHLSLASSYKLHYTRREFASPGRRATRNLIGTCMWQIECNLCAPIWSCCNEIEAAARQPWQSECIVPPVLLQVGEAKPTAASSARPPQRIMQGVRQTSLAVARRL